jgi:Flp pilus assembly protein TadD
LAQAQKQITQKDWPAAVATLEKYTKAHPKDADGFNLLGYSLRNAKRYPEAIQNYQEALRLDPQHRGAHEYLGKAYVQTKELEKAKSLLANLEKICGLQCEEYLDLKKAIDKADKP